MRKDIIASIIILVLIFNACQLHDDEYAAGDFPYEDGEYHIDIEYACDDSIAGSEFYFYNRMEEEHRYIGTIQGTSGQFKTFRLMNVTMSKGEDNRLIFGLGENDKSANVRVRKIILGKEPYL